MGRVIIDPHGHSTPKERGLGILFRRRFLPIRPNSFGRPPPLETRLPARLRFPEIYMPKWTLIQVIMPKWTLIQVM
jgi:hypothetical protein